MSKNGTDILVGAIFILEHFQQKCEAVLRRIMRKNKEIEHFQ
ncbi:hypothetical protein EDF68_104193 [Ochrobactrum sp. BH3]|nr:hypothetical protein EDF68_104193 [Ochrobactrum sp. BH3]